MKTKLLVFCLVLVLMSACQKEKCFTFVQVTTTTIEEGFTTVDNSFNIPGYPKTESLEYITCEITKRDAKKQCKTTTSSKTQNFSGQNYKGQWVTRPVKIIVEVKTTFK